MDTHLNPQHCESQQATGARQPISTGSVNVSESEPFYKPESGFQVQSLYSARSIHGSAYSESPAAYLLSPNAGVPQRVCPRHPTVLSTQPTQPSQTPTHYLLSRNFRNLQFPLTNNRAMANSEQARESRRRVEEPYQMREGDIRGMAAQSVNNGYTRQARGDGPAPTIDFHAENAQLPARMAAMTLNGTGQPIFYGRGSGAVSELEGAPPQQNCPMRQELCSQTLKPILCPMAKFPDLLAMQHPYTYTNGTLGISSVSNNMRPKASQSSLPPAKRQARHAEAKEVQQTVSGLAQAKEWKGMSDQFITRPRPGYRAPFPTRSSSPALSTSSSSSSLSERSSVESASNSEDEAEQRRANRKAIPIYFEKPNPNQEKGPGQTICSIHQNKAPAKISSNITFPLQSNTYRSKEAQSPPDMEKTSGPQVLAPAPRAPASGLIVSVSPPSIKIVKSIPTPKVAASTPNPTTVAPAPAPNIAAPIKVPKGIAAPTTIQKIATPSVVLEGVAPSVVPKEAMPAAASRASSISPTPKGKTATPKLEALASVPKLGRNDATGWGIGKLFSRPTLERTPQENNRDYPSSSKMSQSKENKVEWWQMWKPSGIKETKNSKTAPSIPPPFPRNIMRPSKSEIWIEDIEKESSSDSEEVSERISNAGDWEIIEELEAYDQDERDWEAVKELDNDVAKRARDERTI
ncbi:hypothetical protein TWF718_009309 [Orbilia javanica]|uniref:Uncharacterized protein n=1 Tax=Orbilia javanica TaxID=47235 RepID=A0AAN8RBP9_9PEZI